MGLGSREQPYTGDQFERAYEDTLQGTERTDKEFFEYSSSGGETIYGGHTRSEHRPIETFFPQQQPANVEWQSDAMPVSPFEGDPSVEDSITDPGIIDSMPPQPPLPVEFSDSPEMAPAEVADPFESDAPASIPDKPVDPAAIESPLNGASESAKKYDDKAIDNLIDKLLPVPDSAPTAP